MEGAGNFRQVLPEPTQLIGARGIEDCPCRFAWQLYKKRDIPKHSAGELCLPQDFRRGTLPHEVLTPRTGNAKDLYG